MTLLIPPISQYAPNIQQQLQALQPTYSIVQRGLPLPIWARRGLPDDGQQAWETLQNELEVSSTDRHFCIYIHVPFCDNRCGFCDCYAFALRNHRERHTNGYTNLLQQEILLWTTQGCLAKRPVTTVHFGGGTPTVLGAKHLETLVATLRYAFSIDGRTEWALETTSSSLDKSMFSLLQELGFTRLHIGVQSLQDQVRNAIGRREPSTSVMDKIEKAIALGWIVSVDIIVGLPGETPEGLLNDLNRMIAAGVEGFSVYELQQSHRNRRFFEMHNLTSRNPAHSYLLYQLAFHHLQARGFHKNIFNHWAKERDENLYFTFPQRNEDLLALGTIADGVFGNYHYRHPEYLPYTKSISLQNPGLQGGLRRDTVEDRLHRLEVDILGTQINELLFQQILGKEKTNSLFKRWFAHHMIENNPRGEGYVLTPNGSWFAGQLLGEIVHSLRCF